MRFLALQAIRLYQRYLSPYKGYCCAYASVTGHASCSALGYRAIRRFGVWNGLDLLDRRLHKCAVSARRSQRIVRHGPMARQAGSVSCDLPCDASDACDALECVSDCVPWRKLRRSERVVIPPGEQRANRPPPRYPPDQN
jgi:putative component of membrane protein insertase Oxa1/YidC/SpoIIIJ protein YidD